MNILNELKIYKNKPVALILRHGHRDKIPDGEFGNEILLNAEGRSKSIQLGESLRDYRISKIISSPIERCVQTGRLIMEGYGKNIPFAISNTLGGPGVHITDELVAGEYFLWNRFPSILERYYAGESFPGLATQNELKTNMNAFIESQSERDGITIFITHDSLIAMYDYVDNGKGYTQENWVKYLNGIIKPIL